MDFNQSATGHLRPSDLGGSHLFGIAGMYQTYGYIFLYLQSYICASSHVYICIYVYI
jgi:hypothetical protein